MRTVALLLSLFATASLSLGQAPCCILGNTCCETVTEEAPRCPHCPDCPAPNKPAPNKPAPKKCDCFAKSAHLATSAEHKPLPEMTAIPMLLLPAMHVVSAATTELAPAHPPTGPPGPLQTPLRL